MPFLWSKGKGTFFYDLRTPEEKALLAIKLLVKGVTLRGVAEVLEVKLDTVRYWLKVAAEHSEKVNERLLKGLKVSQVGSDSYPRTGKRCRPRRPKLVACPELRYA